MTEEVEVPNTLELECLHCSKVNNLKPKHPMTCVDCKKPLSGQRYQVKIPYFSLLPFALGALGFGAVDWAFLADENRYPLAVEYSMVEACTNGDSRAISPRLYESKRDLCICTVSKTIEDIPFSSFEERRYDIPELLSEYARECREARG